jgi:casein kinase I family protein HRR25
MFNIQASGNVYRTINVITGEDVAVKLEPLNIDKPKLRHERTVYKALSNAPGIPRVLWFGTERGYTAMVTRFLGPSLGHLHRAFGYHFRLKTVLSLAIQLVRRLLCS